jgi:hypothetical protein
VDWRRNSGGVIARAANNVHYVALHTLLDPHISYLSPAERNRVRLFSGWISI